ncbi:glycosyltransferase family 4 protein [Chryseobacterium sp. BIGb0232]|uniref:glycosyltransferase family 4 protein n=1 Tax=Chryseobacterium sp. BIGb0232 TaxID=2940598 RepID=UPI000F46D532|nr:glycosyltransferase family 4 protein [Chryseobacterium sp. BIGb0232]MCS4302435.1 glycosyltransferase involved in cell wall biosynthesis [Chryseobacterium sp. BIGb0232]ROS18378.1 glycosyltransferase involved in cell wall biosynthesis [Chryseobacterium nakagawai]
MKRIVAVHLLNDYSGSPKVLMQLLKAWTKNGFETHLFTSGGREGFLSGINGVKNHFFWYIFSPNSLVRIFNFFLSQFLLMIKLFFFLKKSDIVYINTVLPFGAAIAGKLKGCKIIYHIHETSVKPRFFKNFLFGVAKMTAFKIVFVSEFLLKQESLIQNQVLLYNVLESKFTEQADRFQNREKSEKIVLMICSLKIYKGVNEFFTLAEKNPQYIFKLVVNASENEIKNYCQGEELSDNLQIYPTQTDTHPFYQEASIILNLSQPDLWVETFGLTILEGMRYRLPSIVPPVGGVTELIANGKNGFLINSKNTDELSEKLNSILENPNVYSAFSNASYQKSLEFSEDYFEKEAVKIVSNL